MAYKAYVVEIKQLREHSNADKLRVATVFNNDVIVGLDVKIGDVMIYFPTDGQLSEEFATANNLVRRKDENGNNVGGYLDPAKRNIKAIRLRGEKSDGLLVPLESLEKVVGKKSIVEKLKIGDSFDVLNGVQICQKYVPISKKTVHSNTKGNGKKRSLKDIYPLFDEHKDTSQLAYSMNEFKQGDKLTVSLKLHGTSGRVSNTVKNTNSFLDKILNKFGIKLANKWGLISGSRRVILEDFDGGYYGNNEFRKQYHDLFEGKLKKGESAYFEIVGFSEKDSPIMKTCDNKKLKDKEFVKKYGDTTTFTYGCENGESDIYVYRMSMTNEDGEVVEYPTWLAQIRCEQMGIKHAPVLAEFNYQNEGQLMEVVNMYEDGADPIGKTHIREGVIVRVENRESFTAYKQKNFEFKVLEGIIKDEADEPDMEEAQDLAGWEDMAYA